MQTGSGSGSSPKVAGSGSQSGESSISGAVSGPSTETQARDDSGHYSAGPGARARYRGISLCPEKAPARGFHI